MASFPLDDHFPPVPNVCHGETTPAPSLFNLAGKTALVTGGNGGIGSGIARGLAEAGADIIIIKVPGEVSDFPSQLAEETRRRVDTYECDLASSEAIRETMETILERDGRTVDILCNVAGISGGFVPILDETDAHRELVSKGGETTSCTIFCEEIAPYLTSHAKGRPDSLPRCLCAVAAYRAAHGRARERGQDHQHFLHRG